MMRRFEDWSVTRFIDIPSERQMALLPSVNLIRAFAAPSGP